MKKANLFALAVIGVNAMITLNETGPLALTPAMSGPGDLSSLTVGLSPDSPGTFPYLAARGRRIAEFRSSTDLSLRTARPASYGTRPTWLTRYLGSNLYPPRFDAQDSLRKGTRVRLVVTGTPQTTCNWAPSFPPFGGHPIPVTTPTWGCQPVTGYSRALVEAFTALDDDTRKLVRESMARSDYYELEWAAAVVEQDRRTTDLQFVVVSDSDLDGREVGVDSD